MGNVYYGKERDNVQSPVAACCISVGSGCLHGRRALLRKAYLERIAVILRHGEAYGKRAYVSRECLSLRLTWFMCTSLNIRPLGAIHTLVDNCRFCSYAPWEPSILFFKVWLFGGVTHLASGFEWEKHTWFYLCTETNNWLSIKIALCLLQNRGALRGDSTNFTIFSRAHTFLCVLY